MKFPTPDRTLWPAVALLVILTAVFESTNIDLRVQDVFYDFDKHRWLVDAKSPLPRILFYTGPKALIWIFGISIMLLLLIPNRWRNSLPKRNLWVIVATLASAPLLVASLKATTHVHTPGEVRRYGGSVPYVKVLEAYPPDDRPAKRGRGFPAGHASGGFALLSIAGVYARKRARIAGILAGLTLGGAMGIYQMLKGAHYLSHTVTTAMLCWIVFLIWRRIFHIAEDEATASLACRTGISPPSCAA